MSIKLIDLYNEITGQAWSMFDGDVEAIDEFEKSVTTSIQKALGNLWNGYDFPFREKTLSFRTKVGKIAYQTPNGNIIRKTIKNKTVYMVKLGNKFLSYNPDCEIFDEESGEPEYFYLKNDEICLYPIPDSTYTITVDYNTIFAARSKTGMSKATLEAEDDYIDIPAKYERVFLNALLPFAMTYAIASETDENYSGYMKQYKDAYKILLNETKGINKEKIIGWK